jgi:hypothetical protein
MERKTAVNYSINILGDISTRLDGISAGFGISIVGRICRELRSRESLPLREGICGIFRSHPS